MKGLNKLSGDICIEGLDNVRNGKCAREANLKIKKHLRSLKLWWSSAETVTKTEGNAEEVIENLTPHSNLKKLLVGNYMGFNFQSWMIKILTNRVEISLMSCDRCERLQPLGQLPLLESLCIWRMSAVKHIVDSQKICFHH